MPKREKVASSFVVAGSQTAIMFQAIEQAFDFVALGIEMIIECPRFEPVPFCRDNSLRIQVGNEEEERIAVIAFIRQYSGGLLVGQERFSLCNVGLLAWRQDEPDRVPQCIA